MKLSIITINYNNAEGLRKTLASVASQTYASIEHIIVVTHFDMTGISETRKDILNDERNRLLQEMVPQGIIRDYNRYHFPMTQYDRLRHYHVWKIVCFIERVLFKLEKWHILR